MHAHGVTSRGARLAWQLYTRALRQGESDVWLFFIVGLLLIAAIAAGFALGRIGRNSDKNQNRLVLYGNVDLRQVNLAFNDSERIAEVLVQEGAKITRGQVLARLETSRLRPEAAGAEAAVEAQQAVVDRLPHGSRPQEIEQAQANVASAKADQVNATQQWTRLKALTTLTTGRAISEQDLESAKAAMDSAQAHLSAAERPRYVKDWPQGGGRRPRRGATARQCVPTATAASPTRRFRTRCSVRCRGALQALGAR